MVGNKFYTWLEDANVIQPGHYSSEYTFLAGRLGDSELFNSSSLMCDSDDRVKAFKMTIMSLETANIPNGDSDTKVLDYGKGYIKPYREVVSGVVNEYDTEDRSYDKDIIMCIKEINGTFYINMDSITGRRFFINEVIQKFGIYRTINRVVLIYSGSSVYSPKVFIREKFIKRLEGKLRNFACIIELLDTPDICDEIFFTPISYTNSTKPWDRLDEHDIFDYIFLNYDRPTLRCRKMVDEYIRSNNINEHKLIKNDTEDKASSEIVKASLIKELRDSPNKFISGTYLKTDSGWKSVQDIVVDDKLLVMGRLKNDISYQDITNIHKQSHLYGIDTFEFRSDNLDIELPVGFKSDFPIDCKPASIEIIMDTVDISLKSRYKNSITLAEVEQIPIKNNPDIVRLLAGIYMLSGSLSSDHETVELKFNSDAKLIELIQLLGEYCFNYSTKHVDDSIIIIIKSRRLYKEIGLILSNTVGGTKKLFMNDRKFVCTKYKAYLLKGMLLYSKMVGTFGRFETTDLDIAELIQELIIHTENKIIQIKKRGKLFILDYNAYTDNDIRIKSAEYSKVKYMGLTYSFEISDKKGYTLVLARDKNGRAFWLGL